MLATPREIEMNSELPMIRMLMWFVILATPTVSAQDDLSAQSLKAMKQATEYFHQKVAVSGGYVYEYSLDLQQRQGEGKAAATEIWVQPPGTPTVGMAFVSAFEATGDQQFLAAAIDAAHALMFGQLESGGWNASIDFDPKGPHTDRYRNGKGRAKGKNFSSLDDDKTQSAVCLLMQVDKALEFRNAEIHAATMLALNSLLTAQFSNGGFPQGWREPVSQQAVKKASYPDYEWRTENRIKEYWYRDALLKLGDFLILAQMPEPQPGWAQQYNFDMQPMWARKFEPPAISGRESEDAMETLLFLHEISGDPKFLAPIEPGLAWLKRSVLADGQIARFYEMQSQHATPERISGGRKSGRIVNAKLVLCQCWIDR